MTTVNRDQYGAILRYETATAVSDARSLVRHAADLKLIQREYDDLEWHKRHRIGNALYHELYDATENAALVCLRYVEGSKYGIKTILKNYVLIEKIGQEIKSTPINKAIAAKAAKQSDQLGDAIDICLGKVKIKQPSRIGYKLMVRDGTTYKSVFDSSLEWKIGKAKIEKATTDHTGGFFYYRSVEKAIYAASNNSVFASWMQHRQLAIVEIEASGREIEYPESKFCATKIRLIRDIGSTI